MEELKARLVAAAFGCVAVSGLWLARPSSRRDSIRVVDQWAPVPSHGPYGDAAMAYRLDLRGAIREALNEERGVTFQVVDRAGAAYNLVSVIGADGDLVFKLPRGFSKGLRNPRLVALAEGTTLGSVAVEPIPDPLKTFLRPSTNPLLTICARKGWGLLVEPTRPIPDDERWRIESRRTPYVATNASMTVDGAGVRDPRRFTIPYAEEAGAVEIDLTRYRLVPHSEIVRIPGLRLTRRYGGTALVVERSLSVPDTLGLDIVLPRQDNGPHRPSRRPDPRSAVVNLVFRKIQKADTSHDSGTGRSVRLEILSPSPEELGLNELRIGLTRRQSVRAVSGDLERRPFTLTARVTVFEALFIETVRAVVRIRVASALAH